MRYIAARRIRFGDGFLECGDPVPVEPGRNYPGMVRLGDVVAIPEEIDLQDPVVLAAEVERLTRERDEALAGNSAQPVDDPFVVYAYATIDDELVCHVYGPTDQAAAEALVPQIVERVEGAQCMVLPLEPVPTFEDHTGDADKAKPARKPRRRS